MKRVKFHTDYLESLFMRSNCAINIFARDVAYFFRFFERSALESSNSWYFFNFNLELLGYFS